MRFALLGNDPDGVAMACALVDSGRHRLAAYTAPVGEEVVRRWGPDARRVADVEEILADPAVEAVLVAGSPTVRPEQLRRALQSERHVLSVFPPDATPEWPESACGHLHIDDRLRLMAGLVNHTPALKAVVLALAEHIIDTGRPWPACCTDAPMNAKAIKVTL